MCTGLKLNHQLVFVNGAAPCFRDSNDCIPRRGKFAFEMMFPKKMGWLNHQLLGGSSHLVIDNHVGVSENSGTPKSSILIGFSIINHPFWGTPILETPMCSCCHLSVGSWSSYTWLVTFSTNHLRSMLKASTTKWTQKTSCRSLLGGLSHLVSG